MPRTLDEIFEHFSRTRDAEALARVFEQTAPMLLQLARRIGATDSESEDAVQELFLSLLRQRGNYDPDRPCLPFLRGALRRQALRIIDQRGKADDRSLTYLDSRNDPTSTVSLTDTRALIHRTIRKLPRPQRAVLRLFLARGLAPQEMARRLGRPAATVRVQLHRGLSELRRRLPAVLSLAMLIAIVRSGRATHPRRRQFVGLGAAACAIALTVAASSGAARNSHAAASTASPGSHVAVAAVEPPQPTAPQAARSRTAASPNGIEVFVRNDLGTPIANVGVLAYPAGNTPDLLANRAVTNRDGMARLAAVPPGLIRVELDRDWSEECTVIAGRPTRIEAAISGGHSVSGQVIGPHGQPVSGASIAMTQNLDRPTEVRVVMDTDATGHFALDNVPEKAAIGAIKSGFAPSLLQRIGSTPEQHLTLRFHGPGGTVHGVVRGPHGPVDGAMVLIGKQPRPNHLVGNLTFLNVHPDIAVRTASDGSFDAHDLPTGRLELLTLAPGLAPAITSIESSAAAPAAAEIFLHAGRALHGKVVDQTGRPRSGSRVYVHGWSQRLHTTALTADDGTFTFRALDPRRCELAVIDPGFPPTLKTITASEDDVEIVVTTGPRLNGTLLTSDGDPAANHGWELAYSAPGDTRRTMVPVDEIGAFTIDALTLRTNLLLTRRRGTTTWSRCEVATEDSSCRATAPSSCDQMTSIRVLARGFSRTQLADLRFFASDAVNACAIEALKTTATDSGQLIELAPLPTRAWQLHVRGASGACPPLFLGSHDVPPGDLQVAIDCPEIGWLHCEIDRLDLVPLEALSVRAISTTGTLVELPAISGRIALPTGQWRLSAECRNAGAVTGMPFEIRAGEVTTLPITLPPAFVTQISFHLPDGLASRCKIELRRDGQVVSGFENRRNLMLSWGSIDGYAWAVYPLQVGQHRLRVLGQNVDLSGEFFVHGESLGEPIVVDLTSSSAPR